MAAPALALLLWSAALPARAASAADSTSTYAAPGPAAASTDAVSGLDLPHPPPGYHSADYNAAMGGPSASTPTSPAPKDDGLDLPHPPPGYHSPDMDLLGPAPPKTPAPSSAPPAKDAAMPEAPAARGPGWTATPSSILLYDSSGTRLQEIGLAEWRETVDGAPARHILRGGACPGRRFAWSFEKLEALPPPRPGAAPAPAARSHVLRYLGTDGDELWNDPLADAPEGLEPAYPSDDGETVLAAERTGDGWTAIAYDFTGLPLVQAHDSGALDLLALSPGGAFGLARWRHEKSAPTYAYLDVVRREARFIALADLPPRPIRVDDRGRVFCGGEVVYPAP